MIRIGKWLLAGLVLLATGAAAQVSTSPSVTGVSSWANIQGSGCSFTSGGLNGCPVGATSPAAASVTTLTTSGAAGIGGAVSTTALLNMVSTPGFTSATQRGIFNNITFSSNATTAVEPFRSSPVLADGSGVTYAKVDHFRAVSVTKSGGADTVTAQAGFSADAGMVSAALNLGFEGKLTVSGSARWNAYMSGTAPNAFVGDVRIGSTTAPTVPLDVTGAILGSTTISVGSTGSFNLASKAFINTAPTIASGLCTSPSISASNGTAAFAITVGTSCSGVTTGTLTMPTATTAWVCHFVNVTAPATSTPSQTGGTSTSVTFTNYVRTTGVAGDFTAGNSIRVMCAAY